MVVTKYCDIVLEPSLRAVGIDFYARGMNIATANLLGTTMPVFLNPKTWSDFLALFVRVSREKTAPLFREWGRHAELIYAQLNHSQPEVADFIAPVFIMRDPDEFFSRLNEDELDPLVPSYQVLADYWGKTIGERYELIADESKVLAKVKDRYLAMSDPNLKPVTIGYDRRKLDLPLKVADIVAVDSHQNMQVQFADVISGAIASAAKNRAIAPLMDGSFARDVFDLCIAKNLIVNAIWPDHQIDPEQLGTVQSVGISNIDPATYIAKVLAGSPDTQRPSA